MIINCSQDAIVFKKNLFTRTYSKIAPLRGFTGSRIWWRDAPVTQLATWMKKKRSMFIKS